MSRDLAMLILASKKEFEASKTPSEFEAWLDFLYSRAIDKKLSVREWAKRWNWGRTKTRNFLERAVRHSLVSHLTCQERATNPEKKQNVNALSVPRASHPTSQAKTKGEASPFWPGCEFFRMSEREYGLVVANYKEKGHPEAWVPEGIEIVELWMANGAGKASREARRCPNHFRRLYEPWVKEQILKQRKLSNYDANGVYRPNHEQRGMTLEEAKAESERLNKERAAEKKPQPIRVKIKGV